MCLSEETEASVAREATRAEDREGRQLRRASSLAQLVPALSAPLVAVPPAWISRSTMTASCRSLCGSERVWDQSD